MESKDFYKEEVRCGYTVTEKTKKVWAVQLAMLDEVERICRKYGLSYFADSLTRMFGKEPTPAPQKLEEPGHDT